MADPATLPAISTRQTPGRLRSIEAARGMAALLVVLFHGGRMGALDHYAGRIPFAGLFNFGHAGVDFFFVLSGFIIYFVHHTDIGRPDLLRRYVWRRLTRIYPSYWIVCAVLLVMSQIRPGGAIHHEAGFLIKSLVLFPQDREPLLGVAWTLVREMIFYIVFALAIIDRRIGIVIFPAWLAAILVAIAYPPANTVLRIVLSAQNAQFFLGLAVAHVVLHRQIAFPRTIAAFGVVLFAATGLCENAGLLWPGGLAGMALFGAAAALLVLGLATAESEGGLPVGAAMVALGGASYALYLIHTIVIGIALRALQIGGVVALIPAELLLIVTAAASVVIAALYFRAIEHPIGAALGTFGRWHIFARPAA